MSSEMGTASSPGREEVRFWAHVERGDGCWPWTGSLNPSGYGQLGWWGKTRLAHRVAWALTHGAIEPGLFVCHRCDNRRCCNPAHLFLGTVQDNNRDRHEKGRTLAGDRHQNAKITSEQVAEIKASTEPRRALAAKFGVSKCTIRKIKTGVYWQGENTPIRQSVFTQSRPGERNGFCKITDAQAREIVDLAATHTQQQLADRFGVSRSTVWRTIHTRAALAGEAGQ